MFTLRVPYTKHRCTVRDMDFDETPFGLAEKPGVWAAVKAAAGGMARPWTVQRHREFGAMAHRCVMAVLLCNGRL